MTKEKPYNQLDIDNISEKYLEHFYKTLFETTENNLMLANPQKLNFQKIKSVFGENEPEFSEKIESQIKILLNGEKLSFGLNPWMDYIFHEYGDQNSDRTILVIGQDWYPLNWCLRNPLVKDSDLSPNKDNKYAIFFRSLVEKGFFPLFTNMVPNLRPGYEKTGKFDGSHSIDFLEKTLKNLKKHPELIITWGSPVFETLTSSYKTLNPAGGKLDSISDYLASNPSKPINLEIDNKTYKWVPLYHPSSSYWTKYGDPNELKVLKSSPVGVG